MKFNVNKNNILRAVQAVARAVPNRSGMEVLANVLMELDGGMLYLACTDFEIAIEKTIPVDMLEAGSALVSAKTLLGVLNKLPNDDVSFEYLQDSNQLGLKCGSYSFSLHTGNEDEFPNIFKPELAQECELDTDKLMFLIDSSIFAAGNNIGSPVLSGVCFEFGEDSISAAATNSYMLAYTAITNDSLAEETTMGIVLVHAKPLNEIKAVFAEEPDASVKIGIDKKRDYVVFSGNSCIITSRLLDGKYPEFKHFLSSKSTNEITVNRQDFLSMVSRAASIANLSDGNLDIDVSDDLLTVRSTAFNVGSVIASIEAVSMLNSGSIGSFNSNFLLDGARMGKSRDIKLCCTGDRKLIIKPSDSDSSIIASACLIMGVNKH